MKKTILALSILPLAVSFAGEPDKAQLEVLQKMGLPTPEARLEIIPADPAGKASFFVANSTEMKQKGYVEKTSDRASELLNFKKLNNKSIKGNSAIMKPRDTDLRKKSSDIVFAYSYRGTPKSEIVEHYGYAPVGTYTDEGEKGWTGGVEFYKTSFGTCAFTEKNMLAAHGSARIFEDEATYDVNGKITLIDVEGNESSGFLYRVHWFDDIFNRDLECTSMKFSEDTKKATIELAKKIDIA